MILKYFETVEMSLCVLFSRELCILKPSSNRSTYIFTLHVVEKVKQRVCKMHAFLNEAILCLGSASLSFKNDVYFLHRRD